MSSKSGVPGEQNGSDDRGTVTDELFAVLADPVRRSVLVTLRDRERPVAVETLASSLAAEDESMTVRGARARLHHCHLPKLVEAGYVTVEDDGDATQAELTETARPALAVIDVVRAHVHA